MSSSGSPKRAEVEGAVTGLGNMVPRRFAPGAALTARTYIQALPSGRTRATSPLSLLRPSFQTYNGA